MAEWIYFLHPPRDRFAETMNDDEGAIFGEHFAHLQQLLDDGVVVLAGPTLGPVNTGIAIFEAEDEEAATRIMNSDPVVANGLCTGELRPFVVAFLRGRA